MSGSANYRGPPIRNDCLVQRNYIYFTVTRTSVPSSVPPLTLHIIHLNPNCDASSVSHTGSYNYTYPQMTQPDFDQLVEQTSMISDPYLPQQQPYYPTFVQPGLLVNHPDDRLKHTEGPSTNTQSNLAATAGNYQASTSTSSWSSRNRVRCTTRHAASRTLYACMESYSIHFLLRFLLVLKW